MRKQLEYSDDEIEILSDDRNIVVAQINKNHKKGDNYIFENQRETGVQCTRLFEDKTKIIVLVIGLPQSGKTGSMVSFIKEYISRNWIPLENIYIITGLSDVEWKRQTIKRMPDCLLDNIYHRNTLTKFVNDVSGKKNVLILLDEIQIAAKDDQSMNITFREAGFYDLSYLMDNDIKFVNFTATPDGHMLDITDWEIHSEVIKCNPGEGYVGAYELLRMGRVKQFKDLGKWCDQSKTIPPETLEALLELKDDVMKFNNPRYHIIRIHNSRNGKDRQTINNLTINNLKGMFGEELEYDERAMKGDFDFNEQLEREPDKHWFIFVKEKIRCAKTLCKKHIGVFYDRYSGNVSDSTVVQSFRNYGYDVNHDSIVYTNIDTIIRYQQLWECNFIDKTIEWSSSTTKVKKGKVYSAGTNNSVKYVEALRENCTEPNVTDLKIDKFYGEEGFDMLRERIRTTFGNRVPSRGSIEKRKNSEGFYVNKRISKIKDKVLTNDDVEKNKYWGVKDTRRWYPCYTNIEDSSTLQWWLIYYE